MEEPQQDDKTQQRLIFGAAAVGALIGLFLAIFIINPQGEFGPALLLEYVKAVLSWPVVVGLIALFVIFRHREELSSWIENMRLRTPGGIEVSSERQPSPSDLVAIDIPSDLVVIDIPSDEEEIAAEPEVPMVTADDVGMLRARLVTEEKNSKKWYFMFLDNFLVPNTKNVLAWLYESPVPLSENLYHVMWQPKIPSLAERMSILTALIGYEVIQLVDENLVLTQIGRQFVEWAGVQNLAKPDLFIGYSQPSTSPT